MLQSQDPLLKELSTRFEQPASRFTEVVQCMVHCPCCFCTFFWLLMQFPCLVQISGMPLVA
jgi:hypothetical protein